MTDVLRATGIRKSFGEREVLAGVDVSLAQHEVVALIGASGSGKSTLLRCLGLLEPIDDGQIWLGDEGISDPRIDGNRVRARFGAVFQSFNLFPHLSVLDNITLASRVVHRIPRRNAEARAIELLARVGLADKAGAHPDRLSGGQQQRVAIARAIAKRPRVLLADEPTGNLDESMRDEILRVLEGLHAEGLTLVVVTHDSAVAARAGRRLRLAKGTVTVATR